MLTVFFMLIGLLLLPFMNLKNWWQLSIYTMLFMFFYLITFNYSPLLSPSYINENLFLDSLSMPLISLSVWISLLMLLASNNIKLMNMYPNKFLSMIIILLMILILTFSTSNIMLFYIMFEASLIPTLFLIMMWGYQPERIQASMYFMMYTIVGSLPLLINILIMYSYNNSLSMNLTLYNPPLIPSMSSLNMWWMMSLMAFLIKMPMYSVHLWLPKAHVEAPVAGSMILAGILLKLGSYGLIRLSMLIPMMNSKLSSFISSLSLWGAIISSMICLRQSDIKSLIAYSSIGHMALIITSIFIMSSWGWQASLTLMISHGLCSSGLFAMANMMYESSNSRSMFLNKGILNIYPSISLWWFIMLIINMAAPPSINLLAEISLIMSIIPSLFFSMLLIMLISFLAAAYSLHLYTSINHGYPSTFFNPQSSFSNRNFSIIFFHFFPLILMIMSPQFIILW